MLPDNNRGCFSLYISNSLRVSLNFLSSFNRFIRLAMVESESKLAERFNADITGVECLLMNLNNIDVTVR